jgi:hypothetical protein
MTGTREFRDTIPVQRREPMPFEPLWYRRRCVAACYGVCDQGNKSCPTRDACRLPEDSEDIEFGAIEGLVKNVLYIGLAWAVVALFGALLWWLA